jgi:hypothetical protein
MWSYLGDLQSILDWFVRMVPLFESHSAVPGARGMLIGWHLLNVEKLL